MHSIPVIIAIILKFIISLHLTYCCIEMLNNHWSQMSVEERIERAEIVLIIKVLKKFEPTTKSIKFYSAQCEIIDVLKGWQSFKKKSNDENGWTNKKSIKINGFGSSLDCLSDVVKDEIYLFFGMFKVDSNLWATYFTSFGAVEILNSDIYERSLSILGLHHWSAWSVCSKKCESGIQMRKRNCVLVTSCDYSFSFQYKFCNWQSCDNTIFSQNDMIKKDFIDIKNTLISNTRNFVISLSIKNQTETNQKSKTLFSLELLDENSSVIIISITNDAIVEIKSSIGTSKIKFTVDKYLFLKYDEISYNIYLNDSGIVIESFCMFKTLNLFQEIVRKFFSGTVQKLSFKKSNNIKFKLSTDSIESYRKTVCKNELYNHSSTFSIINKSQIINFKQINSVSTPIPKLNWSKCSVSCGIGWQKRYRLCQDDECPENESLKSEIRTCFIKEKCPDESCKFPCLNNGQCIKLKCFCSSGYQGEYCQYPICNEKCKNGGKCVGPNLCQCLEGYEGFSCEKIKCGMNCQNGGQCLSPNICTCAFGFTGKFCEKKKCNPPCRNGGICQKENKCSCPEGVVGSRCEKYECYPQCMNGGTCIAKNRCQCPSDFSGSFCEKHICNRCYNGGKCINNMCQCPSGFYGSQCQSKICVAGLKFRKIIRPVIMQFPTIVSNKICIDSTCTLIKPQRSVVVNKVIFKPYIDCL